MRERCQQCLGAVHCQIGWDIFFVERHCLRRLLNLQNAHTHTNNPPIPSQHTLHCKSNIVYIQIIHIGAPAICLRE